MAKFARTENFLATLPTPPDVVDYTSGMLDWGMMLNDTQGDCTCAAAGHLLQAWSSLAGAEYAIPDTAIEKAYETVGHYVPGDPSTDNGAFISDVLNYFQSTGVAGYQISAHAEINTATQLRVQQGLWIFKGLDLGIALPVSAQQQVGDVWDIVGNPLDPNDPAYPGSWGGHSVAALYYSPNGVDCITWGQVQRMTWRWYMMYVEEAHACVFNDSGPWAVPLGDLPGDLTSVGT